MKRIFLPKWMYVLSESGGRQENHIHNISRTLDITYAHVFNIIKELEEMGLLKTEKVGRMRISTLTDRGRQLRTNINHVRTAIGDKP